MTPPPSKRTFSVAPITAPTAGEPIPTAPSATRARGAKPDVQTSRRPEAQTPPEATSAPRVAFTWRQVPDEADQLDMLVLGLRRQLGRNRLDKADVLAALVDLADEDEDVRAALLARLKGQAQRDA